MTSRAGRPGLDYLTQSLEMLFPGSSVSLANVPGSRGGDYELAVLPTTSAPRMLVPVRSRRAADACLGGLGGSFGRRLAGTAVRGAIRAGALHAAPRLRVNGAEDSIVSLLSTTLGEPVEIGFIVGRERATQKPVLRVVSRSGRTLAFAKIGTSSLTRQLVDHEAQTLTRLAGADLQVLRVPTVLLHRQWHGLAVLVQEPLVGTNRADPALLKLAMTEITSLDAQPPSTLASSPFVHELQQRIEGLPDSVHKVQLAEVLGSTRENDRTVEIRCGGWHGDFASWNMAAESSRLSVWDWEGYHAPVPVGFDALHHRLQDSVVFDGTPPPTAVEELSRNAAQLLAPWHVDHPQHSVLLYLMHLVTGYLETGDHRTRLSRLDNWLAPALEAQRVRASTAHRLS